MSRPLTFWQRFIHKNAPSREEVLRSPWLKPFGERIRHSELWRFTRRSVPRGVFAGLLIGIFLMVPGLQIVGAALLSTSAGRLLRTSPGLRRALPFLRAGGPLLDWGRSFNSYSVVRRWAVGPDADARYADMSDEMILMAPTHVLLDFYLAFGDLDVRSGAKGLGRVPVTVACGTKDLLTPHSHNRRLARTIHGSHLVELEGAGHMIPFECHAEVTRVVEDLLDEVGHPVREGER